MTTLEFTRQITGLRNTLTLFTRRFTTDREESSDLVQDTILRALMYKERFTADTNLKGWLFTIMRNTFINGYRKRQRAAISTDISRESYRLNIADHHTFHSPDRTLEYREIWQCVNQLPDTLAQPFKMHTSGYRYHEIARHLKLPIGTVKNRIFHARKEIQKKLAGY